jgi:hypothetical protein
MRMLLAIAGLGTLLATGQTHPGGGAVRGVIVRSDGRPVAGALWSIRSHKPPSKNSPDLRNEGSGHSDGNGNFEITGLRPGPYTVCVQPRSTDLLNPCEWDQQAPAVVVSEGPQASTIRVVMVEGVAVTVVLSDPEGLLDRYQGRTTVGNLLIGLASLTHRAH